MIRFRRWQDRRCMLSKSKTSSQYWNDLQNLMGTVLGDWHTSSITKYQPQIILLRIRRNKPGLEKIYNYRSREDFAI